MEEKATMLIDGMVLLGAVYCRGWPALIYLFVLDLRIAVILPRCLQLMNRHGSIRSDVISRLMYHVIIGISMSSGVVLPVDLWGAAWRRSL
jgi:hypothetical protein